MNKRINTIFWMVILATIILLANCKGEEINPPPVSPQTPELQFMEPSSMVTHLGPFTLILNGRYFTSDMEIIFNGTAKSTTFIDDNHLSCQIEAEDLNSPSAVSGVNDVQEQTVEVYIKGPAPDNLQSNRLDFSILDSFQFNDPAQISNSIGRAVLPQIAVDQDNQIHVCWRDNENSYWVIYYTKSEDLGSTWTSPRTISNETENSFNPFIFSGKSGELYMIWDRQINGGASQIFFTRSENSGLTWSPPVNITHSDVHSWQARGAADENGDLLLVWAENKRNRNYEVYFSRSSDKGATWSPAVNIYPHVSRSVKPVIAAGQGQIIYAAWKNVVPEKGNIYTSRSLDGGQTWETPLNLSNAVEDECREPVIAIGTNGNPSIAWHQLVVGGGFDVMFTFSSDIGQYWNSAQEISGPSFYSSFPAIATDPFENVNMVWVGNGNDLYFIRSTDNGENWQQEYSIFGSPRSGSSLFPDLAVDSEGFVYIVWEDNINGSSQIFIASSQR